MLERVYKSLMLLVHQSNPFLSSAATVLEKVLYIENKHQFRKQAFELLMQFLEAVQQREEAQTDLLGAAISLQPLTAKYSQGINLMTLPLSVCDCFGL